MWLKLDLKERDPEKGFTMNTYGQQYGFDLKSIVDKYQLLEMDKPGYRDQLLKSLERGNLHEITFMKNGKETSGFVTANPQFKSLDFFDNDLKAVFSKSVDLKGTVIAEDKKKVNDDLVLENDSSEKKVRGR